MSNTEPGGKKSRLEGVAGLRGRMNLALFGVYHSPVKLLLIMSASIFATEAVVMAVFYILYGTGVVAHSPLVEIFLDAALLVLLLVPVLYLFFLRPLLHLVSDLASAEDLLVKERDTAQRYLDIAGSIIVVLDSEGKITLVNTRGCELIGASDSELVGRNWFERCVPPFARADAISAFEALKASSSERFATLDGAVAADSGRVRRVRWHMRALREETGFEGVICSGDDVTEATHALSALGDLEARYRMVHNTAFDAIIISDDGDGIVDANPSADKTFGYEPGGLSGLKLTEIMPPEYRERHVAGLRRFLATRKSAVQGTVLELEGLRKDASVFPMEIILGSFTIGSRMFFTGTIRDITERKRAEREKELFHDRLNQAQKMEAIGRLAGGIAHDFNNVLTSIRGNAELTLDDLPRDSDLGVRMRDITVATDHAAKLTRQLLLFSRGQSVELTDVDLNATVEGLLKMLSRIIGPDVEVDTDLRKDLWRMRADETGLEQVIMNLAVNARDAMRGGGRILIKTANASVSEAECKVMAEARACNAVVLTVEDNGEGMAPEVLSRIFEPFFTTKDVSPEAVQGEIGAGFGLSVVYGIVKRHNGWINVKSTPGKGSAFDVYLPVSEPAQGEADFPAGAGQRVLIVELEAGVRSMTKSALNNGGYMTSVAATANEAAALLDTAAFDVMLVDAGLRINAGSLILYAQARHAATQAIVTGTISDVKALGLREGDRKVRYLGKPYSVASLLRAIGASLAQARQRQ